MANDVWTDSWTQGQPDVENERMMQIKIWKEKGYTILIFFKKQSPVNTFWATEKDKLCNTFHIPGIGKHLKKKECKRN